MQLRPEIPGVWCLKAKRQKTLREHYPVAPSDMEVQKPLASLLSGKGLCALPWWEGKSGSVKETPALSPKLPGFSASGDRKRSEPNTGLTGHPHQNSKKSGGEHFLHITDPEIAFCTIWPSDRRH